MRKILIVEDDQLVRDLYRRQFVAQGYEVELASDAEAGLEAARAAKPDAIILDLILPRMSGVEFMRQIRAEPDLKATPVLVFSNAFLGNLVEEAFKYGATKCLSKANCTPAQVLEEMRSLVPVGANLSSTSGAQGLNPAAKEPIPTPNHSSVDRPSLHAANSGNGAPPATDAALQTDFRASFISAAPSTTAGLRALLQTLTKPASEEARLKQFAELRRRIDGVATGAGAAGLRIIAKMSEVLGALVEELLEKPASINVSNLRTVALAIDFLGTLFKRGTKPEHQQFPSPSILVVDDEAISRRAITFALEKAKLQATCIEDPRLALEVLWAQSFDLIFLDVDMPELNGFDLCSNIRKIPAHKKTPVIFVTGLNDFESRATSAMSGGTDLIAKPFLFLELAVKALTHFFRARLG